MDKETLSNYGWIVICVMVLAVMIALATPFGSFISVAIKNTTSGLFEVEQKALTSTGLISVPDQKFDGEGDDYFYDKAENTFAISNYYEVTEKCKCFGAGGCASWLIEQYENHGYNIKKCKHGVKIWNFYMSTSMKILNIIYTEVCLHLNTHTHQA